MSFKKHKTPDAGNVYDLMRRLSDVPELFLAAFCANWSADRADVLLARVKQAQQLSGIDHIRQHLQGALAEFGIPPENAASYLEGTL